MLLIVGTIRMPANLVDVARSTMTRMVTASRGEDGCIDYAYAEDVIDRGLIHVSERWKDRASLDAHFASAHLAEWRAAWPLLGIGERDLALYEVDAPQRT